MTKPPRMLLFSDLHLDEGSAETVLGQVLPGIVDIARVEGCNVIVCLGDFYHVRYRVSVRLQNAVRDIFHYAADRQWWLLPGNHDQVDAAGRNALEVLGDPSHVHVFTEPTVHAGCHWMPYRPAVGDILAELRDLRRHPVDTLFLHYGVRGALQNDVMVDTDGVEPGAFTDFGYKRVICGHYHKPQTLADGLVRYLGSPWQTRADEAGQDKGVYVLDGDDLRFLPQSWGPRHHKLAPTSLDDLRRRLDDGGIGKRDDVRVRLPANVSMREAHAMLTAAGVARFTLTPEVVQAERRLDVADDAGPRAYARAYLDANKADGTAQERDALWSVFERVVAGAEPVTGGGVL